MNKVYTYVVCDCGKYPCMKCVRLLYRPLRGVDLRKGSDPTIHILVVMEYLLERTNQITKEKEVIIRNPGRLALKFKELIKEIIKETNTYVVDKYILAIRALFDYTISPSVKDSYDRIYTQEEHLELFCEKLAIELEKPRNRVYCKKLFVLTELLKHLKDRDQPTHPRFNLAVCTPIMEDRDYDYC